MCMSKFDLEKKKEKKPTISLFHLLCTTSLVFILVLSLTTET